MLVCEYEYLLPEVKFESSSSTTYFGRNDLTFNQVCLKMELYESSNGSERKKEDEIGIKRNTMKRWKGTIDRNILPEVVRKYGNLKFAEFLSFVSNSNQL